MHQTSLGNHNALWVTHTSLAAKNVLLARVLASHVSEDYLSLLGVSDLGVGLHTKSTHQELSLFGVSDLGVGLHTKSTL